MKPDSLLQQAGALVDGELDLTQQLETEARLPHEPALRAHVQAVRELGEAVRECADYHPAPAALRSRLQAASVKPTLAPARTGWWRRPAWQPAGLALAALVGTLVWVLQVAPWPAGHDERLMQEAIASHVRATLGQRLVDVASSDQHTVKPWLSARLDFSPPVHTTQQPGVTFLGGRVDYLDGHPVAALVYKLREHIVDVFVWPTSGTDRVEGALQGRGFNAQRWSHAGMSYWMVSDLNATELAAMAQALRQDEASR